MSDKRGAGRPPSGSGGRAAGGSKLKKQKFEAGEAGEPTQPPPFPADVKFSRDKHHRAVERLYRKISWSSPIKIIGAVFAPDGYSFKLNEHLQGSIFDDGMPIPGVETACFYCDKIEDFKGYQEVFSSCSECGVFVCHDCDLSMCDCGGCDTTSSMLRCRGCGGTQKCPTCRFEYCFSCSEGGETLHTCSMWKK